jgi:hypothetical protein
MAQIQIDRATGLSASSAIKAPCLVTTTANITLSGEQTINGVLTDESRVLVKDQTTAAENGIYISSTGVWTRSPDWQEDGEVREGTRVWVTDGTADSAREFVVTTADDITIGTTAVTIVASGVTTGTVTLSGAETLTSKTIVEPILSLEQGAGVAPTAEGRIAWDTDDDKLKVGDGAAVKTFSPDDYFIGREERWFGQAEFVPQQTSGPAVDFTEYDNFFPMLTLDFEDALQKYAVALWAPPKRWDRGTLTFQVYWMGYNSGGVVFSLQADAISNDDQLDDAWAGTAIEVADTFILSEDLHITPESAAVTVAGSPADGDLLKLRLSRVVGSGSDTIAGSVYVIGVKVFWTSDQGNDA